ncbi:MAG TPA: PqqD family protein [Pyrinomonadaceae bacterium]
MKVAAPLARQRQLIVKHLPNEVLIYDSDRDKAHCLNQTAAQVWQACDGNRDVAGLREFVGNELGHEVPEEVIWLALDQLEKFHLLECVPEKPARLSGITRRELVRRIGFVAIALPVILSITAPTAQAQASLFPPGACCNNPSQCTSGSCTHAPSCSGPPSPSGKACA